MPTLIEMLTDDDPSTRIVVAEQLGLVGPAANAAVPTHLAQAARDGTQDATTTAAASLKSIDWTAASVVTAHFIPLPADNRSIAMAVHQHGVKEASVRAGQRQ